MTAEPQPTSKPPVFVLGAPRSGTSMLHWALCRHEALWGSEESDFLAPLIDGVLAAHRAGTRRGDRHWLVRQRVDEDELLAAVGGGVHALYTDRANGRRWVEQTPSYTLCAGELARMFPNAQFLLLTRDGRQVVDSIRRMMRIPHRKACRWWRLYVERVAAFEATHGERCLPVRYEELVRDTEAALARVFAFLGLASTPRAVAFIRDGGAINAAPGREHERPDDKLQPRWHDWSAGQRRAFRRICGAALRELGYETDARWTR